MVASHNEDTVKFTLEKWVQSQKETFGAFRDWLSLTSVFLHRMNETSLSPTENKVYFGQLLGMCDQISFPLGEWREGQRGKEQMSWFMTCLCFCEQVRRDSRCTSMCRTARWTRSSRTCHAERRRTAASWRVRRESAACCGRSSSADSSVDNCSTNLSTKPQHQLHLTYGPLSLLQSITMLVWENHHRMDIL